VFKRPATRIGQAFQPTVELATIPASVGGVNALDSLMRMPSTDCIYTYNLMPAERGQLLRKGYREWANGCGTGDVRTILNYESQIQNTAQDRLWAITNEGIYNITTYGTTSPVKDITFTVTTGEAGYGVKCEFTNDASDHFMFYADALNGIYQYKEGTGWSVPTGWEYDPDGDGIYEAFPVEDVTFVMVHKQRIWVILEDSDDAWYLPVASVSGQLTKFTFGAKMTHGGDLVGLWTWSVDGGAGVDDMLIAIGRGGDLLVYQGSDPSLGDFGSIGDWFVGAMPASRRVVTSYGSEMYVLSSFGITSVRDLLQGAASSDLRASPSAKINKYLRTAIGDNLSDYEWSLNIHPADGFMQVVTPDPGSNNYVQYNQNLSTRAWGMWEDVPIVSAETWKGEYYMGSTGGVVYEYSGTVDGSMLDGTAGQPVEYRMLTSFQSEIKHATYKRVGFVRTLTIATTVESFDTEVVYDYDINANLSLPGTAPGTGGGAVWDTDTWDNCIWDYTLAGNSYLKGAMGLGRTFAIGMRGSSNARIELVGWDVSFTNGGFL